MADPVSWLQVEPGWNVVTSDAVPVGKVHEVTGDKHEDIFDGLAVRSDHGHLVYVPGELVGTIVPGEVTLKIASGQAATLEPFEEPPVELEISAEKAPLGVRIATWWRGGNRR